MGRKGQAGRRPFGGEAESGETEIPEARSHRSREAVVMEGREGTLGVEMPSEGFFLMREPGRPRNLRRATGPDLD
jgi:hypothetical protein